MGCSILMGFSSKYSCNDVAYNEMENSIFSYSSSDSFCLIASHIKMQCDTGKATGFLLLNCDMINKNESDVRYIFIEILAKTSVRCQILSMQYCPHCLHSEQYEGNICLILITRVASLQLTIN